MSHSDGIKTLKSAQEAVLQAQLLGWNFLWFSGSLMTHTSEIKTNVNFNICSEGHILKVESECTRMLRQST